MSLSKATIGSIATQTWDGSAKTPNPTVKYGSLTLVKDRDYTLSYKNNVQPNAKATVTITGKGNYTGTRTTTFTIGAKSGEWRKSNGLWWWRWADGSYAKSGTTSTAKAGWRPAGRSLAATGTTLILAPVP